jgi:pSer/pThr/pTyr-binding forkhead associated (FHA) protein
VALDRIPEIIVGRGSAEHVKHSCGAASLVIGGFRVSRQHVAIRRTLSGGALEDLGSKNGTIVNGKRVERAPLTDGDLIEVGETM